MFRVTDDPLFQRGTNKRERILSKIPRRLCNNKIKRSSQTCPEQFSRPKVLPNNCADRVIMFSSSCDCSTDYRSLGKPKLPNSFPNTQEVILISKPVLE
ncbi:hypothetical protein CEXT_92651 [Caerostris extrusa]|uniref:Uncharacterized protein n=1 Tax=Caerostris extrusa TaxID=172846 RepID=A0AAV4XFD3_CAEEX|nr:hypothetical protein CEXT_92651 [Caerostris extrusa]